MLRAICLLLLCVLSASAQNLTYPQEGFTPAVDPFYDPPSGWEDKQPGDILRWREIKPSFLNTNMSVEHAYQVLYRTSHNSPSEPSHTVTTIFVPYNHRPNALVVSAVAEDANADKCAISYSFLGGAYTGDTSFDIHMMPYLSMGYITTVPDHEGPLNAFGAGRLEGYMTIDGIRAALNFEKLNLSASSPIAGYGYSGGAIALGWAASLQPKYAPELNIVGWAFGGTPANLKGLIDFTSGKLFSGFIVGGCAGVVDAYPSIHDYVNRTLTDEGKAALQFAREHCWSDVVAKYAFTDLRTTRYAKNGRQLFEADEVKHVFDELIMGKHQDETPTAPTLVYHAVHDEIVPYDDALTAVKQWCKWGANVHMITYDNILLDHITTEYTAVARAVQFLRARLNGEPAADHCVYEYSTTALFQPGVLGEDLRNVMEVILAYFGKHIGEGSSILKSRIRSNHRRMVKRGEIPY
ncbi:hypothetical protein MCUN1_001924 [Malassezia cuniculi]|uniref:triacylglycerol lipase n=1 Tax=Malassezia cuniculi TaxID=948313 RepID=A0AAF0EU49_9BASI|nr:hypothetical protein MCUN1_001924 [Malassezia cuniculi]